MKIQTQNHRLVLIDIVLDPFEDYIDDNPNIRNINFTHVMILKCNLMIVPQWLKSVQYLNLSYNKISAINKELPTNLVYLSLSHNLIKNLDVISELQKLKHLKGLSLKANPISQLNNYRKKIFDYLNIDVLDDIWKNFQQVEFKGWDTWNTKNFQEYSFVDPDVLFDCQDSKKIRVKNSQKAPIIRGVTGQFTGEPSERKFGMISKIKKRFDNDESDSSLDLVDLIPGSIYNFQGIPCKSYYSGHLSKNQYVSSQNT